jgi:hypothetical protein
MLDAIKRWISGGSPGPDWSEFSEWAQRHGRVFRRAHGDAGFVVEGSFSKEPWRLEWGPPQRVYITARELRLRMELQLPSSLQMLLMSRSLMETLERETFERYTVGNQTVIDTSTPEEMRWLAMFPKVTLQHLAKEARPYYGAVAADAETARQWVQGVLAQRLADATTRLLRHEPPFLLMTLRGRLYLRMEMPVPEPGTLSQAVSLFEAAAQAARAVGVASAAREVRDSSEAPHHWSDGSEHTAWTDLHPEPPKRE